MVYYCIGTRKNEWKSRNVWNKSYSNSSSEKIPSPYDSMKYISKRKLQSSLSKDKLLLSERKMQKEQQKSEELKVCYIIILL